jgi:hypothetical protein
MLELLALVRSATGLDDLIATAIHHEKDLVDLCFRSVCIDANLGIVGVEVDVPIISVSCHGPGDQTLFDVAYHPVAFCVVRARAMISVISVLPPAPLPSITPLATACGV